MVKLTALGCVAAALVACGEPPAILVEPLQIVSWVPNRGAQCVAATAEDFRAAITFSDDIASASLTTDSFFVRPEDGEPLSGVIQYDKATQTASLTAAEHLEHDTVYELVATDELRGVERGHLIAELRSPFTTVGAGGCF